MAENNAMVQIKAMLVMLSEFLQTTLSDDQIRLYAHDLQDIGPEGLATAIKRLRADPSVWAGRFPLPAKLKSYLSGTAEDRAIESANKIMACTSYSEAYRTLSPTEILVMKAYGMQGVIERNPANTTTVFAQLRELMRTAYTKEIINGQSSVALGAPGEKNHLRQEGASQVRSLPAQDELWEDSEPSA